MEKISFYMVASLVLALAMLAASCSKKKSSDGLIFKNGLFYKEGSSKPYTGREKAKAADKTIEYDIVNGVKQGEFKVYYSDGKLQMAGQMYNNKNEGLWKYYYDSPQLESEGNFKNDLPEGKWIWYFFDGKLRENGSYLHGKRVGVWQTFNELGNKISEKYFDDGKEISKKEFQDKKS